MRGHGTDPGRRRLQVEHDREAREGPAKGGGARFRDWEAAMMFYEIVIILDGHAEARGMPAPKSHKTRRAIARRHLPRLADFYNGLYSMSPEARYCNGYGMTEKEWQAVARCREALARSIPARL